MTHKHPAFELTLADSTHWSVQAQDDEAATIVEHLGRAMMLQPDNGQGRRLLVEVDGKSTESGKIPSAQNRDPVRCVLSSPDTRDMLTIQMTNLSLAIARDAQVRGGLLLHAALAELDGKGVILAGSGNVGKSTASRRLPPPWKSLCDDTCLVIKDVTNQYCAHPWPTWSLFFQNGPGGSWDVQHAVPLQAIFFLCQSSQDKTEPLNCAQAASMLMASAQQVTRNMTRKWSDDEIKALYSEHMAAAEALARSVPAYVLHISLTGTFWVELERVLRTPQSAIRTPHSPLPVVYSGPSMNPTLRDGDLLEVVPYAGRSIRKGDVIYFQRNGERAVVHRVCAVMPQGIKTRGDNNTAEDPYTVQRAEIIGQVVAAQRAQHKRKISGGFFGQFAMHTNRLRRALFSICARMLKGPYQRLADKGTFRCLPPSKLQPRVVAFQTSRYQDLYKLVVNGREIGRYDERNEIWRIGPPYRLFVDETRLPRPERQDPQRPPPAGDGSIAQE